MGITVRVLKNQSVRPVTRFYFRMTWICCRSQFLARYNKIASYNSVSQILLFIFVAIIYNCYLIDNIATCFFLVERKRTMRIRAMTSRPISSTTTRGEPVSSSKILRRVSTPTFQTLSKTRPITTRTFLADRTRSIKT